MAKIVVTDKDNKSETAEAATVTTNLVTQSKVNALVGRKLQVLLQRPLPMLVKQVLPWLHTICNSSDLTKVRLPFRATFIDEKGKSLPNTQLIT